MADIEARLACASSFILQSPPGEVNDVFNDVRALVGDDTALETGILPALQKYNVEQLIVADLPDKQQLLICSCGSVEGEESARFIEPSTAKAWQFDHLRLTASDPVDVAVDQECESIRLELEKAAFKYGKEHFSEGVSKVFTTEQRRLKPPPKAVSAPVKEAAPSEEPIETAAATSPDPSMQQDDVDPTVQSIDANLDNEPESLDPEAAPPGEEAGPTSSAAAAGDGQVEAEVEPPVETAEKTVATTMTVDEVEDVQAEESTSATEAADTTSGAGTTAADPAAESSEAATEELEPPTEPLPKKFSLFFVGNKYNPSNYWTGRWRSSYELDLSQAQATLKGSIQLNVHFFEQGNVQLSTSHTPSIPLPETITSASSSSEVAKAVLKAISKTEEEYQLELNEVYRDMADKTFRNLRRVLPVTRQKMDWAKVASYKMGRQLGGGKE